MTQHRRIGGADGQVVMGSESEGGIDLFLDGSVQTRHPKQQEQQGHPTQFYIPRWLLPPTATHPENSPLN